VNQFGARISGSTDFGATIGLTYMHRRHYFDIPAAGSAKVRPRTTVATPTNF